jgi:peptidoglycan/xylan/chitin deacetylase (PgdA/CDA1 family)
MLTRRQFLYVSATSFSVMTFPLVARALTTVTCPILMYHYISTPPADASATLVDLAVLPEAFDAQLAYLADNGFTPITLKRLYNGLKEIEPLPEKPIVLTFDDGHWDMYANVTPMLLARGMVGTTFLISSFMDQPNHLTWGQAQEIKNAGMEIGAHSVTHQDLSRMDRAGQEAEIGGCADAIEQQLGVRPEFFCYPLGLYNRLTRRIVKEKGYLGAVTTSDTVKHNNEQLYVMGRVRVRGTANIEAFANLVNR